MYDHGGSIIWSNNQNLHLISNELQDIFHCPEKEIVGYHIKIICLGSRYKEKNWAQCYRWPSPGLESWALSRRVETQ